MINKVECDSCVGLGYHFYDGGFDRYKCRSCNGSGVAMMVDTNPIASVFDVIKPAKIRIKWHRPTQHWVAKIGRFHCYANSPSAAYRGLIQSLYTQAEKAYRRKR